MLDSFQVITQDEVPSAFCPLPSGDSLIDGHSPEHAAAEAIKAYPQINGVFGVRYIAGGGVTLFRRVSGVEQVTL